MKRRESHARFQTRSDSMGLADMTCARKYCLWFESNEVRHTYMNDARKVLTAIFGGWRVESTSNCSTTWQSRVRPCRHHPRRRLLPIGTSGGRAHWESSTVRPRHCFRVVISSRPDTNLALGWDDCFEMYMSCNWKEVSRPWRRHWPQRPRSIRARRRRRKFSVDTLTLYGYSLACWKELKFIFNITHSS